MKSGAAGCRELLHPPPQVVADVQQSTGTRRAKAGVLVACACLVGACAASSPATARPDRPLIVGISDQSTDVFGNSFYRRLGVQAGRMIVPWDAAVHSATRARVAAWLAAAEADGVEPFIAFSRLPGDPVAAPPVDAYRRAFEAFRDAFPEVRDYTPWNEENHPAQPTFNRPARAAAYYEVVRDDCPGCKVVAADVLDTRGSLAWLKAFMSALHGPRPRLWGLHNYIDVNRHRPIARSGTAEVLALVPGQVWLTETGGLVKARHWPYNERRAARAIRYAFTIAHAFRSRIARIYIHNWHGVVNASQARQQPRSWDAGLTAPSGRLRRGYYALRGRLKRFHLGCWSRSAPLSAPRFAGCE